MLKFERTISSRSRSVRWLTMLLGAFCATLIVPASSLASEGYLLDVLTGSFRSRGSCVASRLETEGDALFSVNGLDLPTYTVPGQYVLYANGDDQNLFRAPFSSALFTPGANVIDFRIASTGDDQTCVDAVDVVTLSSPSFGSRQIFSVVRRGFAFSGATEVSFSLTELNPALAKSIATLLEFIRGYRSDLVANAGGAAQRDAEIAAQLDTLAKLERDLDALAEQGFDDIDVEDLEAIFARYPNLPKDGQAALAKLVEDLHKSVEELRTEVDRVMDEFAAQADSVDDFVTRRARQAGWDPENNSNYESHVFGEQVPAVSTPDVGAVSVFDGSDDFYDRYAASIVSDLSDTVDGDQVVDKEEFASIVAGWRKNQDAVERIIRERATVNLTERQAFVRAQNKVLAFVRKYMDEGDWFKDAPVSPELKRLLDGVIKQRFNALAARIKGGMNRWTVLGTQEQMLTDMTVASGSVLENGYDAEPDEVKGVVTRVLGWVGTAVTVGVGFTPIGDVLDACEAITGRELCKTTGTELETWQRVAAGLGVVVGSGKFWQVVGSAVSKAKSPATYLATMIATLPKGFAKKLRTAKEDVLEGLFSVGHEVRHTVPEGLYNWYRDRASTLLKKALGPPPSPTGFEAHHIVDVLRESNDGAIASRQILARYGVRINEKLNGIWLNKAAHDLTKKATYGRWVAGELSVATSTDEVIAVLARIKQTLEKLNADPTRVPW